MGYKKDAIKGVSWLGSLRVATRGISFLRIAVIARLLSPAQFGVFAIATLVLTFIETITETGINALLIQEKERIEKFIDSAWIVSIIRGIIIAIVIIFLSGYIAEFFNTPESYELLLLISVVPFLRGFINPAVALFMKDLHFHKEFLYRLSIFLVESIVSVLLVIILQSPSGLVWGLICGAIYEVLISHMLLKIRPRLAYNYAVVRQVISRGKWLTAAGIFDYLFYHGDNVVVGKILGNTSLGLYDMAYRISLLPITEVGEVIAKVMFPVFTKFSEDKNRLKKAYLKATSFIVLLTLPIGIILFSFPTEIIAILLGDQWLDAASVLQVLAIFGVIRAITNPCGAVFLSVKKQEYITLITFVGAITMLAAIIPLVNAYGLLGAGIAAIVASVMQIPFIIFLLIKVFKKYEIN